MYGEEMIEVIKNLVANPPDRLQPAIEIAQKGFRNSMTQSRYEQIVLIFNALSNEGLELQEIFAAMRIAESELPVQ